MKKIISYIIFIIICGLFLLNLSFERKNKNNYIDTNANVFNTEKFETYYIDNNEFVQTIKSKYNYLNKIYLFLKVEDSKKSIDEDYNSYYLELELKDSKFNTIEKYKYEKVFFQNNQRYLEFSFPTIKYSEDQIFYLHIRSFKKNMNISVEAVESLDDSNKLSINDKSTNYSLIYYTSYDIPKNNFAFIVLISLIFISLIFALFLSNKIKRIENKYLLLSIILGLMALFLTPLYHGQDEISHMARIYDLSNGNMTIKSKSDWPEIDIPSKIVYSSYSNYSDISGKIFGYSNPKIPYLMDMQYTSVYSIVSYLPQVVGLKVGRIITSNAFIWPYIVRLFELISCIVMIYYAIKIIPFGKKMLMLIGLLPSTITQISLISADALLISGFMLFLAKIIELSYKEKEITKKDYIILFISGLFVALSKLVYIPLTMLLVLIPLNKKDKKITKNLIIMFIIFVLLVLGWNLLSTKNLVNGQGVNVIYYIDYYKRNIIEMITIIIHTFIVSIGNYISDLFGGNNKWYGTMISDASIVPTTFFIIYMIYMFKGENRLVKRDKIIIGISLVLTYILISISLLLTCTPVHYKEIIGIQGRYFIPYLMCIYLIISNNKKDSIKDYNYIYIIIILYFYYFIEFISNYI